MQVNRAVGLAGVCLLMIGVWAGATVWAGFPVPVHSLPLLIVLMVGLVGYAAMPYSLPRPRRVLPSTNTSRCPPIRRALLELVGEEDFISWFNALEFESTDGQTIRLSVPVTFLKSQIDQHFAHVVLQACRTVFPHLNRTEIIVRSSDPRPNHPHA